MHPILSLFLILWVNTGDNCVLFEPMLWKRWSSFLSLQHKKGAPCSHWRKETSAAFAPLHCHVLSATSPRQTQSFHPGLSGELMQRATKQARKFRLLKRLRFTYLKIIWPSRLIHRTIKCWQERNHPSSPSILRLNSRKVYFFCLFVFPPFYPNGCEHGTQIFFLHKGVFLNSAL